MTEQDRNRQPHQDRNRGAATQRDDRGQRAARQRDSGQQRMGQENRDPAEGGRDQYEHGHQDRDNRSS